MAKKEKVKLEISYKRTERGFGTFAFKDRYRKGCTLQESSLATEGAVWFGIDDPEPQIRNPQGPGWVPFSIPDDVLMNTRMHLTQQQVKELLPYLKHFAKTGYLPKEVL